MPRLLAVDGNSLGHRGYHSLGHTADAGDRAVTGAVVSMLATAWGYGPYDGVVVAFDHPVNRRRREHPEYKANRPPTPEPIRTALTTLRTDLAACGLTVVEEEGLEADDLLAAVADGCGARRWRCDVLSSDRDLTALVEDRIRLLRPRARFSDLSVEDVAAVRRRYGVEPHRYTELAALRGDPSDGLEGAVGIGEKTAAKLLREYGSVAALYERLSELPAKVEASLRTSRERVERNLLLMAPVPHVDVDVEGPVVTGLDVERLTAELTRHGLDRAAHRLRRAITNPVPPPPPTAPPPATPHNADDHGGGERTGPAAPVTLGVRDGVAEQAPLF